MRSSQRSTEPFLYIRYRYGHTIGLTDQIQKARTHTEEKKKKETIEREKKEEIAIEASILAFYASCDPVGCSCHGLLFLSAIIFDSYPLRLDASIHTGMISSGSTGFPSDSRSAKEITIRFLFVSVCFKISSNFSSNLQKKLYGLTSNSVKLLAVTLYRTDPSSRERRRIGNNNRGSRTKVQQLILLYIYIRLNKSPERRERRPPLEGLRAELGVNN